MRALFGKLGRPETGVKNGCLFLLTNPPQRGYNKDREKAPATGRLPRKGPCKQGPLPISK